MLEVIDAHKSFGAVHAVDGVSFTLKPGTILGLVGKNGAGKSTLFRIILNILEPDKGEVLFNNKPYTLQDSKYVGFLPEEGSLNTTLTVYEQMCFYGSLKGMDEEQVLDTLKYWLDRFNILEYLNKKIKELSKGNRQRIQFIVAILNNPDLIILDEPFSGLDPIGVEDFKNILMELKAQGKAIIYSSHRIEHVEKFSDEVMFLDKGKIVLTGTIDEVKGKYILRNEIKNRSSSEVTLNEVFINTVGGGDEDV